MTAQAWLNAARSTIQAETYCFLITQSERGGTNARLMQPFEPEEDLTIYFGASPRSRKVREIERNQEVTVTYQNSREHAYVCLLGQAQVEKEIDARRQYWREEWAIFWPGGPESEDYVLIRFVPSRIELMNISRKIAPEPRTQPAVLVRAGEDWAVPDDEHAE
jgi:general stress protein 26